VTVGPAALESADIGLWLNGTTGTKVLSTAEEDCLRLWPVPGRVNEPNGGDDDPDLIDEVAA